MPKYRRKPTTVEATQWDGRALPGVSCINNEGHVSATGLVTTMQGQNVMIRVGEWVVTESDGVHHYPIEDQEFRRIYALEIRS